MRRSKFVDNFVTVLMVKFLEFVVNMRPRDDHVQTAVWSLGKHTLIMAQKSVNGEYEMGH